MKSKILKSILYMDYVTIVAGFITLIGAIYTFYKDNLIQNMLLISIVLIFAILLFFFLKHIENADKMKEMGDSMRWLHEKTRIATIGAFTATHFDMYAKYENQKKTFFKCFNTNTHGNEGFFVSDADFEKINIWLVNQYEKNGFISYKERIQIEDYFVNKVELS
jgi:uncharacterized membrane protein